MEGGPGVKIDSNIKMWCRRCQACTKGDACGLCHCRFTVCAECGYCFRCLSTAGQRAAGEDW